MLGDIMAGVSHELRNPLGTIRSSLFSIKNCVDDEGGALRDRALERAERSIHRCDHIIEELLELSRAREVKRRVTPLDTWIKNVLDAAGLPDAITCETDLQANVAVSLDREKMRGAMMKLISNSVQSFDEKEGGEHRLMVSSLRSGHMCQIRITDSGSGMSPEVLDQVGKPLFSTRAFGVGLGVPVVRETVRGHGGEISFESEAGKGTTVIIELPVGER